MRSPAVTRADPPGQAAPGRASGQTPLSAVSRLQPNLVVNVDRPLRYSPDGQDFVIENGGEFFNRPLYGGNTAFRVDAGDQPEFSLYLPGQGGNLRFGVRSAHGAKWLHETARITARYRPGTMLYEIRDPLLGASAVLHLLSVALHQTDGLIVRVEASGLAAPVEIAVVPRLIESESVVSPGSRSLSFWSTAPCWPQSVRTTTTPWPAPSIFR